MTSDALAWQIMDCRVAITGLGAALVERVRDLFLAFPAVAPLEADPHIRVDIGALGWCVRSADGGDLAGAGFNDLLVAVCTAVNTAVLERTDHLAVHAGVVAHGPSVLAFPAESGAGKSTLTAACVERGMAYLSDEALCIETNDALAVPYPKPLTMSASSLRLFALDVPGAKLGRVSGSTDRSVSPGEIGAVSVDVDRRFRVQHVVLPVRGSHATQLKRLPASTSVTELLRHSFNAYLEPRRAVHAAVRIAREARCWELHYEDARSAAILLEQELDRDGS